MLTSIDLDGGDKDLLLKFAIFCNIEKFFRANLWLDFSQAFCNNDAIQEMSKKEA